MASFGFCMVALFRSLRVAAPGEGAVRMHQGAVHFGIALLVLGLVATVLSGVPYWFTLRRLSRGARPILRQWPLSVTVAMLLAVMGLTGLWALFERCRRT
jgi:hypothetical protein